MIKLKKFVSRTIALLFCAIAASQCIAQSNSLTADSSLEKQKQYLDVINSLYFFIQQNYVDEVDPQVLYEGALKGMLGALNDPYSVYMDQSEWRGLTDTTVGEFGGVGLSITKPNESTPEKPAYVEVASPIDDTPGARAGIQAGDLIIRIDGVDTSTITMEQVLGMLRGTVGESVTVTIRRRKSIEFDRVLVRAKIENPTVKYGMLENTGIGYIRISEFSQKTADRVQEAIDSFKSAKYKGLIIDLRNNGGGLLTSAVKIADKFIDSGVIVQTKSRLDYENSVYYAKKSETVVKDIPVVVLVNRASASASEILSGALKDTKKAYLIGEKTYGKGSVQIPNGLYNGDGFKITVAKYYSPTDVNIDKVGIYPDKEIPYEEFSESEEKAWKDLEASGVIPAYVENHPDMTEAQISAYAESLRKTYALNSRIIRKLVRNQVDRTKPSRLYDLDYDNQLKGAIEVINNPSFKSMLANTQTLKDQANNPPATKDSKTVDAR